MATQEDIEAHYDEGNDFYALFLDKKYRVYTSAVWATATNLEQAQVDKLERMSRYANIQAGDKVMDVGCGFGGLMTYVTEEFKNTQAHGVTLSSNQAEYINSVSKPNVSVDLCSWEDYPVPESKYDAIVSVCALEHFVTFEENVAGKQRDIYKKFFDWCLAISTPDAQIGMQSIVITRPPNNLLELRDSKFLQEKVFPGSALSCISDIQAAIVDKYEINEATRIGLDYVKTLAEWKRRLESNKEVAVERFGQALYDHYIAYFDSASRCFETGYWDVFQASLRRAKSPNILPK
ncbi:MAG: class I SAM-dependent methyltransferase [Methylotenera sp.]